MNMKKMGYSNSKVDNVIAANKRLNKQKSLKQRLLKCHKPSERKQNTTKYRTE